MTATRTPHRRCHLFHNILGFVVLAMFTALDSPWCRADDWPSLGRDATRNPVSLEKNPPRQWDDKSGKHIKWSAELGLGAYGTTPVVAGGLVWVGANSWTGDNDDPKTNAALLRCFRESDGELLYEYVSPRLPGERRTFWQGLSCSPLVEGDLLWFVTNRQETVCLDIGPLRKNGAAPRVVWKVDMIEKLGVHPRALLMGPNRLCSIGPSYQGRIYVTTSNAVNDAQTRVPASDAPSLVCFDNATGKILWTDNSPGENILVSGFSSPLVAEIAGRGQVIAAQGDGWIRSFDPLTGKLIWKFDVNPKLSRYAYGRGARNYFLAPPVLYKNRIYIASGAGAEEGEGPGRLVCIDPTKQGEVSSELAVDPEGKAVPPRRTYAVDPKNGEKVVPNPNSALVWEFGGKIGQDYDKHKFEDQMHRSMASVAVHDGLVVVPSFTGLVHCLDAETGRQHWVCDLLASIWASPLIVDDKIFIADEDGIVSIFHFSKDPAQAMKQKDGESVARAAIEMDNGIYTSPIYANSTLYITTRSRLYAIAKER